MRLPELQNGVGGRGLVISGKEEVEDEALGVIKRGGHERLRLRIAETGMHCKAAMHDRAAS